MAIKRGSKVEQASSASAMTDLMFLMLIFLLISTTLISPNALKLMLPQSSNVLKDKAVTTVSIEHTKTGYNYYVEREQVANRDGVETALKAKLGSNAGEPTVSLHTDRTVAIEEVVQIMNMARRNNYRLILATTAN